MCFAKSGSFCASFSFHICAGKKKTKQKGSQASHVLRDDFVSQDVHNRVSCHPFFSDQPNTRANTRCWTRCRYVICRTYLTVWLLGPRFVSDYWTSLPPDYCELCFREHSLYFSLTDGIKRSPFHTPCDFFMKSFSPNTVGVFLNKEEKQN